MKRVYIAGPDIFFRDAAQRLDRLVQACAALGVQAVLPCDGETPVVHEAKASISYEIYQHNLGLIRSCDAVCANLMDFRGCEPDAGTVFEWAYAVALGKPVAGYFKDASVPYEMRVPAKVGATYTPGLAHYCGAHDARIESFNLPVNLMVARSGVIFTCPEYALNYLVEEILTRD